MLRTRRSAIEERLAAASPMPTLRRNCQPACWHLMRQSSFVANAASGGLPREVSSPESFETALAVDELLVAVEIPIARKNTAHFFHEFARRHGDYAIAALAAQAVVEQRPFYRSSACVFCAWRSTGPGGRRGQAGQCRGDTGARSGVSAALAAEIDPHEDQQASSAMRRHLAKVLFARASPRCWGVRNSQGSRVTTPMSISLQVNGERVDANVLPRLNLADFLREHLQLTGTHVGCEHGVCGACTVSVDGEIVRGCLMLAVQAHGASVQTIEVCPTAARSPICRTHSVSATPCSAAIARRAC